MTEIAWFNTNAPNPKVEINFIWSLVILLSSNAFLFASESQSQFHLLLTGYKSFTSLFGIGNQPIPPSVESGSTNPTITDRFTSNPVQEISGSTTGSSNFSALSYRQEQGF